MASYRPSSESTEVVRIGKVSIAADTVAGTAYVNKITHPPSTIPADFAGTPDNSDANVVLIEVKGEVNLPPILTLPTSATATATTNPSSMLFVQTSGLYASTYVFLKDTNNTWVQPMSQAVAVGTYPAINQLCPPTVNNSGYNFKNMQKDISQFRTTYGSDTYYLNATDFNNQGTVTTAKFRPNIFTGISAATYAKDFTPQSKKSLLDAINAAIKHQVKYTGKNGEYDMCDHLTFKKLEDMPSEYLVQIWTPDDSANVVLLPFSQALYQSSGMPNTASDVLVMSSKAATRPAKEGAFVVQQQIGPIADWCTPDYAEFSQASLPSGLSVSLMRCPNGGTTGPVFAPLFNNGGSNSNSYANSGETKWNNLDWSYTLFEGLTVPSTTGTTLSSVPYITVKSFKGFEASPFPHSSLLPFQRSLPMPDPKAIQMAVGIMHARPDSLPASANDFGMIGSLVTNLLPKAVEWIKDLFGPKAPAPHPNTVYSYSQPPVYPGTYNSPIKQTKRAYTAAKAPVVKAEHAMSRQIAQLSKQVAAMRSPASTLPTYTNGPLLTNARRPTLRKATVAVAPKVKFQKATVSRPRRSKSAGK
jgi:hypothetical protein